MLHAFHATALAEPGRETPTNRQCSYSRPWVQAAAVVILTVAGAGSVAAQQTDTMVITRRATRSAQAGPSANFTGRVRVEMLFAATSPSRLSGASVAFEPGSRSAWHTHPVGQLLIVTAGTGRIQQWGRPAQQIREGDVIWTPAGVKHWHGATPTTAMTHTAIQESVDGRNVDWLEKVSDAQYTSAPAAGDESMAREAKPKQGPYADIAPALDEITQGVLFGQVWERSGLSKRDRSLITVATLIASYRTNELPYHLNFALQNGVTKEELTEVITHLAFYAGWPSANTAVEIARKVFAENAK
jgi:4-carboxymuconolactone decarboxylase